MTRVFWYFLYFCGIFHVNSDTVSLVSAISFWEDTKVLLSALIEYRQWAGVIKEINVYFMVGTSTTSRYQCVQ